MLVPNPPGSICQRAPVVPHTRGKDEMRGDHLVATSLFGRDPFLSVDHVGWCQGIRIPMDLFSTSYEACVACLGVLPARCLLPNAVLL